MKNIIKINDQLYKMAKYDGTAMLSKYPVT